MVRTTASNAAWSLAASNLVLRTDVLAFWATLLCAGLPRGGLVEVVDMLNLMVMVAWVA
jgi:hypothetical protein